MILNCRFCFWAQAIMCWAPLEDPSQKMIAASAYVAICWFRIHPAPLPYFFQSAGNRWQGMLCSLAHRSPSVSAPLAVPLTTSVMFHGRCVKVSRSNCTRENVLVPAIIVFILGPFPLPVDDDGADFRTIAHPADDIDLFGMDVCDPRVLNVLEDERQRREGLQCYESIHLHCAKKY